MTDQDRKITPPRARARERAAQMAEAMQEWRRDRIVALEKRREERRKARANAEPDTRYRGPEGGTFTIGQHLYGKRDPGQERPLVTKPRSPWPDKRPNRKPRRRDLPGAQARRLERNRRSWIQ
jgi:hypothetical protein